MNDAQPDPTRSVEPHCPMRSVGLHRPMRNVGLIVRCGASGTVQSPSHHIASKYVLGTAKVWVAQAGTFNAWKAFRLDYLF